MEKDRTKKITMIVLIVAIIGLTVAFAALSQNLTINGSANVDAATWNIHFDNLGEAQISGEAQENAKPSINEDDKVRIDGINVTLNNPKDKVVYNVDLVNEGSIDAEISNIITPTLTEEQEKYLEFKVAYSDTDKELAIGDLLNKGETKHLTITIRYKDEIDPSDLPKGKETISLSYELTFTQSDGENIGTTNPPITNNCTNFEKKHTYNTGDVIAFCNNVTGVSEDFYVIKDNGDTVSMLSKYNLLVGDIVVVDDPQGGDIQSQTPIDTSTSGYGLQSASAKAALLTSTNWVGTIAFSNSNYWYSNGLKQEYGTSYPADVYDSNSLLYSHVENYENYFKNTLGKSSVNARLITYNELISLGCSDDENSCLSAPSWVYTTTYWSASARNDYNAWTVVSNGYFGLNGYDDGSNLGVRPVITVLKSDI